MNISLFNRLYSYRQRKTKNNRENFLIELLGYTLENHEEWRLAFLRLIGVESYYNSDDFSVSTQAVYDQGRPDLELQISEHCVVLIECKVESSEGSEQLSRYRDILNNKGEDKKALVYLTKYIESKEDDIVNLRWYQLVDILESHERSEILNEFMKYLKEEGMDTKDFNLQDLNAIITMQDAMNKMDEVLDRVVGGYAEELRGPLKDKSSRPLAINRKGWYGDDKYLGKSSFIMAFRKQSPDGWPEVFAEFGIRKRNDLTKESVLAWCQELDYTFNEDHHSYYCGRYENIMTMTESGQDMTDACIKFFEKHLADLQKAEIKWQSVVEA